MSAYLKCAAIIGGVSAILFSTIFKHFISEDNLIFPALLGLGFVALGFGLIQWIRWEVIRKLLMYRNWMYDQKSTKTKVWGMVLSSLMPKKNKLYELQEYLPRYPLPKLEDTCKRTLSMVEPLLNDEEYKDVVEAMAELMNHDGPKLQKILERRHATEQNWLSELWDKYAYLAGRSPIPVYSNFATLGDRRHKENFPVSNQLSQAANCVHSFMAYKEKIEQGSLRNMMLQNMIPICCDRYKYVCSTTRIPGEEIDELKKFPDPNHAIVFRKGYMYKLVTYATDLTGKPSLLTPREIQTQLETICKDADEKLSQSDFPVLNPSIFTTANRTKWAQARKKMLQNNVNEFSLNVVESAAFCISLDTDKPKDDSEQFHLCLTGDGFNRWFDKSASAVVHSNLAMGINVEHSSAEATLSGRMWEYMFYHSKYDEKGDASHQSFPHHDELPSPLCLEWDLQEFKDEIVTLKKEWDLLEGNLDAHVFFLEKGKGFIKKLRISPDGYLQMALQLAFYRLHKETPKTYETAATRLFKLGRTETIRSVSKHSVSFTKAFDDPSVPKSKTIEHLKAAIQHQTRYKYDAMNGTAVDRHLFGLYVAGKLSGSVPKLFSLKPFNEHDRLSTSQSPLRYDPVISKVSKTDCVGGGFGAQRPDGYGVSYFMDENKVHFLITSYKSCPDTGSAKFATAIRSAVDDMQYLLESAKRDSVVTSTVSSNGKNNGKAK